MASADVHLEALLKLPVEERAHAAKRLLDSLDQADDDTDDDQQRVEELTARVNAVAGGAAELVDAAEVRRRIAARLRDVRGQ